MTGELEGLRIAILVEGVRAGRANPPAAGAGRGGRHRGHLTPEGPCARMGSYQMG